MKRVRGKGKRKDEDNDDDIDDGDWMRKDERGRRSTEKEENKEISKGDEGRKEGS